MNATYAVQYIGQKSDRSMTREFTSLKDAFAWAKEFVRQSYRNEASAVVYEVGNCMNLARYENVNGLAVKKAVNS